MHFITNPFFCNQANEKKVEKKGKVTKEREAITYTIDTPSGEKKGKFLNVQVCKEMNDIQKKNIYTKIYKMICYLLHELIMETVIY